MGIEHQTLDRWLPDRQAIKDREDRRKNNGDATRLGKYNGKPDQLARKFRLAIRELMTKEEIQALLEERLVQELKGLKQVKIAPTIFKIAAGQNNVTGQGKPEKGWMAPAVHVHMNMLTEQQLEDYYLRGILPPHLKNLLPGNRDRE